MKRTYRRVMVVQLNESLGIIDDERQLKV